MMEEDILHRQNLLTLKTNLRNDQKLFEERVENLSKTVCNLRRRISQLVNTENLIDDSIDKIIEVEKQFGVYEFTTNALTLSHSDKLRKCNNYLSKLKTCIKMYMSLNEKLDKEIRFAKSELIQSNDTINNILTLSPDELNKMQEKIKRYEKELNKFEKKYPWLQDSEMDFISFSKKNKVLNQLRTVKDKLIEELDYYQGLKPDLMEASRQVEQAKNEYQEINQKLLLNKK